MERTRGIQGEPLEISCSVKAPSCVAQCGRYLGGVLRMMDVPCEAKLFACATWCNP